MKKAFALVAVLAVLVILTRCNKSEDEFFNSEQIQKVDPNKTAVGIGKDEVEIPPVI